MGSFGQSISLGWLVGAVVGLSACSALGVRINDRAAIAGIAGEVEAVAQGNYVAALQMVNAKSRSEDALLTAMNRAAIFRAEKKWVESNQSLNEAWQLSEKLRAISVGEQTLSVLVTETAKAYEGAYYERLSIPIMSALNHLDLGDCGAARVEMKRMDEAIRTDGNDPKKIMPWAVAFSGMIYELLGERDQARVAYKNAEKLYGHAPPSTLTDTLKSLTNSAFSQKNTCAEIGKNVSLSPKSELQVIVMRGHISPRREARTVINMGPELGGLIPIVLPTYGPKPTLPSIQVLLWREGENKSEKNEPAFAVKTVTEKKVSNDWLFDPNDETNNLVPSPPGLMGSAFSKPTFPLLTNAINTPTIPANSANSANTNPQPQTYPLSLVANFEDLARADLNDNLPAMTARLTARVTTRKMAARAAVNDNKNQGFANFLADLSLMITENADIRTWPFLPSAVYWGRQTLPTGHYRIRVAADGDVNNSVINISLIAGRTTTLIVDQFSQVTVIPSATAEPSPAPQ